MEQRICCLFSLDLSAYSPSLSPLPMRVSCTRFTTVSRSTPTRPIAPIKPHTRWQTIRWRRNRRCQSMPSTTTVKGSIPQLQQTVYCHTRTSPGPCNARSASEAMRRIPRARSTVSAETTDHRHVLQRPPDRDGRTAARTTHTHTTPRHHRTGNQTLDRSCSRKQGARTSEQLHRSSHPPPR
jgi:hypothetical protein